jgi:hypothetical protein
MKTSKHSFGCHNTKIARFVDTKRPKDTSCYFSPKFLRNRQIVRKYALNFIFWTPFEEINKLYLRDYAVNFFIASAH